MILCQVLFFLHLCRRATKKDKENDRPISIRSVLSKVHERLMYNQLYPHFGDSFSKILRVSWKGFNTQYCLLYATQKRKSLH